MVVSAPDGPADGDYARGLRADLAAPRLRGISVERERAVGFYSNVMSHLKYFKTIRDEAAHARAAYDEHLALSALERVREFMTLLAQKIT
jgi:hypothetical protein